jgi:hypothetical protein
MIIAQVVAAEQAVKDCIVRYAKEKSKEVDDIKVYFVDSKVADEIIDLGIKAYNEVKVGDRVIIKGDDDLKDNEELKGKEGIVVSIQTYDSRILNEIVTNYYIRVENTRFGFDGTVDRCFDRDMFEKINTKKISTSTSVTTSATTTTQPLSDSDVERVATRVIETMIKRLVQSNNEKI